MSSTLMWIRVAGGEQIPIREGRAVVIRGREIAIFNVGDRFLAVDGRCPHKGGPLCDGIVSGDSVVCPLHTYKIGLTSGCVERPAGTASCVRTYETKCEDGIVMLRIDVAESAA